MFTKLKRIKPLLKATKNQKFSMQRKLMIYLIVILTAFFLILTVVLTFFGIFSDNDKQLSNIINVYHTDVSKNINKYCNNLSARGIKLAKDLSAEYNELAELSDIELKDFNDSPYLIKPLEEKFYIHINNALQSVNCSGAYFILDATVNSQIDRAEDSRSSLYLRYVNINVSNPVTPYITYYRGIPDIARVYGIELHNRWNLEADISRIPEFNKLKHMKSEDLADETYIWSKRISIAGTWENAMILCVPIRDARNRFVGMCGFEVSELYFMLLYPGFKSDYGSMTTVLAASDGKELNLSTGLKGGVEDTYPVAGEKFNIIYKKYLNIYKNESSYDTSYVGIQKLLDISEYDKWYSVTLLPIDNYNSYIFLRRIKLAAVGIITLIVVAVLSAYMSNRFVAPIVDNLQLLREESVASRNSGRKSGILEIDELVNFLNLKSQNSDEKLPPKLEKVVDKFIEKLKDLSPQERIIFNYYIEGHDMESLPGLTYISLETIKKHNLNIYKKLGINSLDELIIYIDLLKRCSRINELY